MEFINAITSAFKEGQVATGNESEDCLFLNVFTPDASSQRKRPVLFWLHGGGFAIGSAGEPVQRRGACRTRRRSGGEQQIGPGKRSLAPVVDGDALPAHPFDPAAPEVSRSVPIVIGTNKDENTLFSIGDPKFGAMSIDDARNHFKAMLREKGDAACDFYTRLRPNEKPTYLVTSMGTESGPWISSIRLAERKNAQGGASVFMYRLDYETPILGGILRSPHGLDTPMVFGHAREFARMLGDGPEPERISAAMMDAWIAFARSGNPSTPSLAWPTYASTARRTMIFAAETRATADGQALPRVLVRLD